MTELSLVSGDPAELDVDVVVIALATGPKTDPRRIPELLAGAETLDKAFGGELAAALAAIGATGRAGELTRLPSQGHAVAPVLAAVGIGAAAGTGNAVDRWRRAAAVAARTLKGSGRIALALPGEDADRLAALAEGALLGGYDFTAFRHSSLAGRRPAVGEVLLVVADAEAPEALAALARGQALADSVALTRDLVNTPPGDLPPTTLAEIAVEQAKAAGVEVEVFDTDELAAGGYGGILGVGQGSADRPPRLVKLTYSSGRPGTRHVALVGKGITFDSGGLSIKPAASMETMKSDMAGAAAVLGTVLAAAKLELDVTVTGWMPLAENMPSGTAIRPGDVLTMRGGTRVEVLNTDAEGRLVLADALTRACEDSPDAVIDIATLTGAQVVALGSRIAALMANSESFRDLVQQAADRCGEGFWQMPLPSDLRDRLDSPVADLSNVAVKGGREAGMLIAGVFLQEFIPAGIDWAHLDIAGPSFHGGEAYGYVSPGGTGFGVRTMLGVVEAFARQDTAPAPA